VMMQEQLVQSHEQLHPHVQHWAPKFVRTSSSSNVNPSIGSSGSGLPARNVVKWEGAIERAPLFMSWWDACASLSPASEPRHCQPNLAA
jgi:hypothetical protein